MIQQQKIKATSKRSRRSVGERAALVFLLIWGALFIIWGVKYCARNAWKQPFDYVILIHGLLSLLGGLSGMVRNRPLARALTISAAFVVVPIVVFVLWTFHGAHYDREMLPLVLLILLALCPLLLIALGLITLGVWLGNQKD
ncbi:hypothetical protein [Armatimonas sp.]|uniref:hypothetical protein n=1 Tax=Armatimonas sp. TaxID=1872638 RepID=UPI00286A32E0|nr:hypothetical protein [Armatimonas sp.]